MHKFKTRNSFGMKLEVSGGLFKNIIEVRRVMIGWETCIVYESFDVTRCFKCCGYHHLAKSCNASVACSKCGWEHDFMECKSESFNCVNCVNASKSIKDKVDTNHSAFDPECPVFKRKLDLERKRIDYDFSSLSNK